MPDLIESHKPVKVTAKRHEKPAVKYRQKKRSLHTGSAQWRKLRQQVLYLNPLCVTCHEEGRIVLATEVDHINGDASRHESNRLSNLQGLCKAHHSKKTAQETNRKIKDETPDEE